MNTNRSDHDDSITRRTQCPDRPWCDCPAGHLDEHSSEADLPKITATANREDFVEAIDPDGIAVPQVFAYLVEHEHSNTFDHYSVQLTIVKPDGLNATCHLNLHEAGLLAKALHELLAIAGSAR